MRASHVHVERDDHTVKFWLDPLRLQVAVGFRAPELRQIERIIEENRDALLEAWNEYFGH